MTKFAFWNLWHRHNKIIYLILLFIFFLGAAIYLYAAFEGTHSVIHWEKKNTWEKFGVLLDRFQVAFFDFDVFADNYIITETFTASPISINFTAAKGYLLLIGLALSVILAVVTVLPRFWYIAGMAFFIFFVTNFKLEQLQLFGRTDFTALIFVFFMYIPVSYYIHANRQDLRLSYRILIFLIITTIVGIIIGIFSTIDHPWLYLANYGLAGPVILSLIFIFLVSHEIIVAILFIITNYNTSYSKNSLLHFSALSIIYLLNVLFAYLDSRGAMDWDIFYINAFVLLVISAVVGIWGFKKRSTLFENMIPMNGPGEMIYLSMAIICFTTIGYLFFTANDPILETFEDAIIFTHFGFGTFFFIYILVNFMTLLMENMRVYRIVYKPVRMPYFMSSVGGLAIVVLLLFRANLYPYSQAVSGYFNGVGDVYVAENNLFLAEQYYRLGTGYGYQNHKSNYSLASLATRQNDPATALFYFKEAISKNPSDYAYVNLANIYNDNSRLFDAVFTLKDGLNTFPESGPIKNNLAIFYNKLNMKDSSLIFLEDALDYDISKNAAQTNALALYGKAGNSLNPDTADTFFEESEYIPVLANRLVIKNRQGSAINNSFKESVFQDSILDLNKFSYLNNYTLNTFFKQDTAVSKVITQLQFHPANGSFQENLDFLKTFHSYYHHDVALAFQFMENLQAMSIHASGYYNYILGIWAMEQKAPLLASKYFSRAKDKGIEETIILEGVALSISNNPDRAREYWSSLLYDENQELVRIASNMIKAINIDRDLTLPEESEIFIYRVILFNYPQLSEPEVQDMLEQLHDPLLQAQAIISIIYHNIENRNFELAKTYLADLAGLKTKMENVENEIHWIKAYLLAFENDINNLKAHLPHLHPQNGRQKYLYHYFQALILESQNKHDEASDLYRQLGYKNPFVEPGVIAAANYFKSQNDALLAYDILRQAVEINHTSVNLHKHFILTSLQIGLNIYAESALQDFKELVSEREYNNFYSIYKSKLEELKLENSEWN